MALPHEGTAAGGSARPAARDVPRAAAIAWLVGLALHPAQAATVLLTLVRVSGASS